MNNRRKNSKPEPREGYIAKQRRCLMCGDTFRSEHAGERICRKCKSTAAWRSS